MSTKINAIHLQRDAYVYVRQSTGHQVRAHPESQRRQYALADQARGLGFAHVIVIDEDVGRSGTGRHERPGFGQLLAAVCAGRVGAVLALEASRLARNNRHWHHLIDLWASITASATLHPFSLSRYASRRTEGRRGELDGRQDGGKHRPGLLPEKPFRCRGPICPREEEVMDRGQTCPLTGMIETSQLMVPQREVPIAPFHVRTGTLEHVREFVGFLLQPLLLGGV